MLIKFKQEIRMDSQNNYGNNIKIFLYALGILLFFSFFYHLGLYPILDVNEGLYAEISREMLIGKNYIVPILNQALYLEKPPLLYWLTIVSYKIFGINAMSARLIPALSATIISVMLVFLGYISRRLMAGIIAGLIFASSFFIAVMSRVVIFDMLLAMTISTSLIMFFAWYQHHNNYEHNQEYYDKNNVKSNHKIALKYLLTSYIFLGLVFLTKGMIGLCISCGSVMLFLILRKSKLRQYLRLFNPYACTAFLFVVVPWIIAITYQVPNFLQHFFINEQLLRFLNERIPHDYHEGNWWFYFPRIIAYLFPWSLLIPNLLCNIRNKIQQHDMLHTFLWSWILFPLLIFSLSGEKGDCYMIVSMPALAMLIAEQIETWINNKKHQFLNLLFYLVLSILIVVLVVFALDPEQYLEQGTDKLILYTLFFVLVYGLIGVFLINKYRKFCYALLLLAGLNIPLVNFYVQLKQITQNDFSQITLAKYMQKNNLYNVLSKNELYLFRDYEELSSIVFLLQKPIKIIDSASRDLFYGQNTTYKNSNEMFVSQQSFINTLNNYRKIYVIVTKKRLIEFENFLREQHKSKVIHLQAIQLIESGDGLLYQITNS